jgi:hypothetical protein
MNWNPMPNNTPTNSGDAVGFVTNFRFGDQHKTGDPVKDMAMETFNRIKDQYGHNAAWSFATKNWNELGGNSPSGLSMLMQQAGITNDDRNRIINTYGSSRANYFPGLRQENRVSFDPNDPYKKLTSQYDAYKQQYHTAKQQGLAAPALPQGYSVGAFGAGSPFQATGTNRDQVPQPGYGGSVGLDPSTGKPYGQAGNVSIGTNSQPTFGAPAVPVPPSSPATLAAPVATPVATGTPTTTDPMGTAQKQSFRYRPRKPIGF